MTLAQRAKHDNVQMNLMTNPVELAYIIREQDALIRESYTICLELTMAYKNAQRQLERGFYDVRLETLAHTLLSKLQQHGYVEGDQCARMEAAAQAAGYGKGE